LFLVAILRASAAEPMCDQDSGVGCKLHPETQGTALLQGRAAVGKDDSKNAALRRQARSYVTLPEKMLAFYYFVGDCPDQGTNVPPGMLKSGNAIMLSFIESDQFSESNMTYNLPAVAKQIKSSNPDMYVAYSVGGMTGSTCSSGMEMFDYLSKTPEDDIVKTILDWEYADGIDWDIEPPSICTDGWDCAAGFGSKAMSDKIVSISKKLKDAGMGVTMAGFGSWTTDINTWKGECGCSEETPCGMSMMYGTFIASGVFDKFGIMYYSPAQGDGASAIPYVTDNWEVGASSDVYPALPDSITGVGADASKLAGGISGSGKDLLPISIDDAVATATVLKTEGKLSNIIVWMVKPDECTSTSGWVADNPTLDQWTSVLDVL
jgi:hypothetical protein